MYLFVSSSFLITIIIIMILLVAIRGSDLWNMVSLPKWRQLNVGYLKIIVTHINSNFFLKKTKQKPSAVFTPLQRQRSHDVIYTLHFGRHWASLEPLYT